MVPIISIVGPFKADRTILIEKLIPRLRSRGYKVATIKQDVHGYDLDTPNKTSWRHSQAGAQTVIISSPARITMFKKVDKEWSLDALAKEFLSDVDIVIADGFTKEKKPKIKVLLSQAEDENQMWQDEVFSLIGADTDRGRLQRKVPEFGLEEIEELAELIVEKFLKKR